MRSFAQSAALYRYIPQAQQILGLIVVFIGSLCCLWLSNRLMVWTSGRTLSLSSLTLAILFGILLGNTLYPRFAPQLSYGVDFAKGEILRLAIILYGFKLTLTQVTSAGMPAVLSDAMVLTSTFLLTYWIGTKLLKVDKHTTLLIGSGASICGAAAVIAAQPVIKAEAYKPTIAVATVVVFGTIAMLLYPFLYHLGWLQVWLSPQDYGVYTGATIHEVAQVVVAGNAISPEVGDTAVVTKMIRVMMLAPFLLLLSFALTKSTSGNGEQQTLLARLKHVQVPWFAFIFILVVILHTWLPLPTGFETMMVRIDDLLLTMAMFALGLTTHLSAIKQAGVRPLILGAIMFAWLILGGGLINVMVSFI